MSAGLVDIRDAVCKCLNEDLQALLDECGVKLKIGYGQTTSKNSTSAKCVYKPSYDKCKQNDLQLFVIGKSRSLLLAESIAGCRGKEKALQNITSEYSIAIELVSRLCGKDEEEVDAYPINRSDELMRTFEAIEDLLFCKRQIEANGSKYYQEETDPYTTGYDEYQFSEGLFIKSLTLTYRLVKCCPK